MEAFEISPFVAWQTEASTHTLYLMDTRNEEMYFLEDEVSKTILKCIIEGRNLDGIYEDIVGKFHTSVDIISADVNDFLQSLLLSNLIIKQHNRRKE